MKTQDIISLKERNQKALKNFIMWREKKQEHEEEDTDYIEQLLFPNLESSLSHE